MDNAQVEQELEELESKLERLRALYEQYFLGLEKLEPSVLRKEVDRRFWTMRREQVRNTGLRFKFQMLIQRYNTYQQYWTRVVREIESGTYRRDIIKVAKRFGEKDALTILGKKRADQYRRLAANQTEMRDKRKNAAAAAGEGASAAGEARGERDELDSGPVSIAPDDVELDEDDGDDRTVTPLRPMPPVREQEGPDMESLLQAATVGVKTWAARPPKPPAREAGSEKTAGASVAAMSAPAVSVPAVSVPAVSVPAVSVPAMSAPVLSAPAVSVAVTSGPAISTPAVSTPAVSTPAVSVPAVSVPAVSAVASGKSRVAELAAQMRAKKAEAAKPKADELELDRLFDAPAAPKPAAPPAPPAAKPAAEAKPRTAESAPKRPSTRPPPKPTVTPATEPAPRRPSTRPPPKPAVAPGTKPAPAVASPATVAKPAPALVVPQPPVKPAPSIGGPPPVVRAAPTAAMPASPPKPAAATPPSPAKPTAPAPPAAAREDLSEQKMRDIYAKYVGAKRAANESTAGITFDKLASSLRAQADKLKTSHPTRSVDFEVVTKDGKTALRPIVK